jgi:hypothetical protein
VDAIGVALSDTNTIYAVENPFHPQVFVTIDHGATWTEHEIVPLSVRVGDLQVDPIDPNTAYAVINNFSSVGNIFRTTDGGASWTSITGNLPNEPVWSLQIDPTTTPHTLYLGADDGVYVSTNSGVSWSRFGEGLPDAQAFQLELNPSLHLLGVATHGRGMWEILTPSPAVTVTNVTSLTPDGTYGAGATISIQVTFSGTVNVTGTPQLTLNSGGTANYASGSVGSTLTFIYTVAAGERSSHLDYNSTTALSLNSGTINDTAGNAANLTLPASGAPGSLGANSNIVIGLSSCLQTGVARLMGLVRTAGGREMPGIPDVTVTLTGPGNCEDTTTTNAMGHYVFRALGGGTYTVTPEKDGCSFIPRSRTISVAEADPRANFRGMCRDNR